MYRVLIGSDVIICVGREPLPNYPLNEVVAPIEIHSVKDFILGLRVCKLEVPLHLFHLYRVPTMATGMA